METIRRLSLIFWCFPVDVVVLWPHKPAPVLVSGVITERSSITSRSVHRKQKGFCGFFRRKGRNRSHLELPELSEQHRADFAELMDFIPRAVCAEK